MLRHKPGATKNMIGSSGMPIPHMIFSPVFGTATRSRMTIQVASRPKPRTTHHRRIESTEGICV